jgi:hypothetical protein
MLKSDGIELKVLGVYRIPCECGKVYVGQSGSTVKARSKEHKRHGSLDQPEKLAVSEHSIKAGQHIYFIGTYQTEYQDTWTVS